MHWEKLIQTKIVISDFGNTCFSLILDLYTFINHLYNLERENIEGVT